MTAPDNAPTPGTETVPSEVTIDRVAKAMSAFDVTLDVAAEQRVGTANLNGLLYTFAVIGSVLIVRAEAATDTPSAEPDATWYLAANHINCTQFGARAAISDRAEVLTVRTESEVPIAAGLSDAQLASALQRSVDATIAAHDGMQVAMEEYIHLRERVAEEGIPEPPRGT